MRFWLTADLHLGHSNIIRLCGRPFSCAAEMEDELVRRHNALVGEQDVTIDLGDFAFDRARVGRYLARLNGRRHLLCGNHDGPFSGKRRHQRERLRYLAAGFASVNVSALARPLGQPVLLCHFPPQGDSRGPDRYAEHRPDVLGYAAVLCGHVHERWARRGNAVNVGVDARGFAPVSASAAALEAGVDPAAFEAELLRLFEQ